MNGSGPPKHPPTQSNPPKPPHSKLFDPKGLTLKPLTADVVDGIWAEDQPPAPGTSFCLRWCLFGG